MGEVWKARDTRLDREVAIKIGAGQFTARFEREARAIAASGWLLFKARGCFARTRWSDGRKLLAAEICRIPARRGQHPQFACTASHLYN
jgi:hypothetical protein